MAATANRSGGPVPKALTSGEVKPVPKARTSDDANALPKARTTASPAPAKPQSPPPPQKHSPRLSEQLRALPRDESDLPDIPILAPRDDSKVSRNWTSQPPKEGRSTTRHVKTGTAVLTLESEDAVVIETDDDMLVQESDNKIKAISSATGIEVHMDKVPGKSSRMTVAAVGPRVSSKAAAAPEAVPVATKNSQKGSKVSKAAPAVVAEAPAPEVPVVEKKSKKASRISKVAAAVADEPTTPAPLPVAEKQAKKSSRISKAAKVISTERPIDDHTHAPEEAPAEPDDLVSEDDLDDPADEHPEEAEKFTSSRRNRASARTSARGSARGGSARASARGSSRSSGRGSRRVSKEVDPVARKKKMLMIGGGALAVVFLLVAFWYITGPMKTGNLIADIKGPDAAAAKRAVPELADHLRADAVDVYGMLADEITEQARLEMLGEGLIKTTKMNSRGTAALAKNWLDSKHVGLRKAAAYALTKFSADNCADGLIRIVNNHAEEPALRVNAATALGVGAVAQAAEPLGDCVLNPEETPAVQSAAVDAMIKIKEVADSKAFLNLMHKYTDSALRRKLMEYYIVDDSRRTDDDAFSCYKLAMQDPDKELRLIAVKKIPQRFEAAKISAAMLPFLHDPEPTIGVEVARFLGTVTGSGKQEALKTVLAGIQDTTLDGAVRKQLTVSLGYLSEYKDMIALKILIDSLQAETDPAGQANLRDALTQVCSMRGGGNDRSGWSNEQWIAWYTKYIAFRAHFAKIKQDFDKAWEKFNNSGGMANEELSAESARINEAIMAMGENECDPEDRRAFEQVETEMMMKNLAQMHKGGNLNFYPGNKKQ